MKKMIIFLMATIMLLTLVTGCSMLGDTDTPDVNPTAVVTATPAVVPTVEATVETTVEASPSAAATTAS